MGSKQKIDTRPRAEATRTWRLAVSATEAAEFATATTLRSARRHPALTMFIAGLGLGWLMRPANRNGEFSESASRRFQESAERALGDKSGRS